MHQELKESNLMRKTDLAFWKFPTIFYQKIYHRDNNRQKPKDQSTEKNYDPF